MTPEQPSSTSPQRRSAWLPLGLVVLTPLIFYGDLVFGLHRIVGGELLLMDYPFLKLTAESLARGDGIPLWTPQIFFGFPAHAYDGVSVFYPGNLLLLLAPDHLYYLLNLAAVLHLVVAGLGAYRLARHLGLPAPAAGVSGLVYSLNGMVLGLIAMPYAWPLIAWTPWFLRALDRLLLRVTCRRLAGTAALVALLVLGGMYQYLVCALLLGGLLTLYRLATTDRRWPALRRAAGVWVVILPLGLGGAAIELLPTARLAGLSARQAITYEEVVGNDDDSLTLAETIHLLTPTPFGYRTGSPDVVSLNAPSHIGLAAAVLVVLALLGSHRRDRWLWGGLALLGLLVAAGDHTPVFWLFYHALYPVLFPFKDPNRYLFLAVLPLALLAGQGAEALVRLPARQARMVTIGGAVLLLAVALAALAAARATVQAGGASAAVLRGGYGDLLLAASPLLLLLPGLVTAVRAGRTRWIAPLPTLAVALTLLLAGADGERRMSSAEFTEWLAADGLTRQLQAAPGERYLSGHEPLENNLALALGLRNASGQSSLLPFSHLEFSSRNHDRSTRRNVLSWRFLEDARLAELAAVRHVVLRRDQASLEPFLQHSGYRRITQTPQLSLWRRPAVRPRAWFVDRVVVVPAGRGLVRMLEPDFDPAVEAVVEGLAESVAAGLTGPERMADSGRAVVLDDRPDQLDLQLETDRDRFLVINDTFFPGWVATLDGQAVPIWRTDHLFRGVVVPAGRHRLELRYTPLEFVLGAAVSGASWLLIALLALPGRRAREAR